MGRLGAHNNDRSLITRTVSVVSIVVALSLTSATSGAEQSSPQTGSPQKSSPQKSSNDRSSTEKYAPNHPRVRGLIAKAIPFLEKQSPKDVGELSLISIILLNENAPKTHPKIVETLQQCERVSKDLLDPDLAEDIYNTSLATIFLCNYDSVGQRQLIQRFIESLNLRQKPQGGWGYQHGVYAGSCDTSQTQYAILAYWYAQHKDAIKFPADRIARACNWLIVTQDPQGAWGYQGREGTGGNRVEQTEVRHSLCAAGLGSVYICANMLHLTRNGQSPSESEGIGPLRRVIRNGELEHSGKWAPRTKDVPAGRLKTCMRDGDAWFQKNFAFRDTEWVYYYMYAYERYASFREIAEGRFDPSPAWYNTGVEFLQETQTQEGSWYAQHTADTTFAVLFLQRSTQKVLDPLREGRLTGGRGLPRNLQEARVLGGKIQGKQFDGSINDLLAALEDPLIQQAFEFNGTQSVPPLSSEPDERRRQLDRLHRMIAHDVQAPRLAAVKLLAGTKDLDEVPYLIFALTDPDPIVMQAASDGLRQISRKLQGLEIPAEANRNEILQVAEGWKAWYRSVRPDAHFLD